MNWYKGTISEAVNISKENNAIFVVFVEGDNELSRELAETIDSSAVLKRLSNPRNFLAVKLKSGSENYTYFAQIYQFVPVPSLFFIGRNGAPLEVVCPGVPPHSLAIRIDRILQEHRKLVLGMTGRTPLPSTSAHDVRDETNDFIELEAKAREEENRKRVETLVEDPGAVKQIQPTDCVEIHDVYSDEVQEPAAKIPKTEYEVVCDGDVCVRRPKDQGGPSRSPNTTESKEPVSVAESEASIQEKMERAKELIEIRRREKEAKQKEEEKQKEKERRAQGQGVAELKKWQADQELKQIQEERKREKMENNLARQRILEQIAQDRAERKAREQPAAPPAAPAAPAPVAPTAAPVVGDAGGRARVQFKLPDGAAHTAHFAANAPLAEVQRYVVDNLNMPAGSFSLWTAFPRRELDSPSETLLELRLAPSAALLVMPRRTQQAPARPAPFATLAAFITQLITSLVIDPTYQIFSWIRDRIFPTPTTPPAPATAPTLRDPQPPGLRRRGNIHRLAGDRSGDDDNNTWNGNSTQQM